MTENELRNAVCAQARAWLGRQESDNSHREIIDLYNKYRRPGDYFMTYVDPWCAAFSSACGMAVSVAAGLPCKPYELIPASAACDPKIVQYKAMGRWMEDDNYLPSPGDEVFYDWDDSGYGDNMGSSDHVGIVVSVSGSSITVVEGNKSDSVSYRVLQRNGRYIRGYGLPDYAGYAAKATKGAVTAVPPSGIDISNWQKGIDLTALQTGFIICKISEGTGWTDPSFDVFYNTAKVPVGAYVYSHATTPDAARSEAQKALSLLAGRKLPLGVYIDVEESAQLALSNSALTEVVKAFCDTIKAGGYRAGAYGSAGNLWAKVSPSSLGDDVLVWVAIWGAEPRISCDIWQYSDHEKLDGYTGNLDGDKAMSERFISIINGSEPTPQPVQEQPRESYRTPAAEYHAYVYKVDLNLLKIGDKGPLVHSLQLLLNGKGFSCGKDDGEFENDTRDALVKFQTAAGILADGECGGQSWAALHNYRV